MDDLISRLSEIRSNYNCMDENDEPYYRALSEAIQLASTQPKSEERTAESAQNVPNDELIPKKAAIDAMCAACWDWCDEGVCKRVSALQQLPSAQPTIFGYDLKQIIVIAEIMKKENLPPERVNDALADIERIVTIVRDEFEETLRESMNQFKI